MDSNIIIKLNKVNFYYGQKSRPDGYNYEVRKK